MSEDNACEALWYVLPYLRVFDERFEENLKVVTEALKEVALVQRIDKRHLRIEFLKSKQAKRFLKLAKGSILIDVDEGQDDYFYLNEWTSLKKLGKANAFILRVGIEETSDLEREFNLIAKRFSKNLILHRWAQIFVYLALGAVLLILGFVPLLLGVTENAEVLAEQAIADYRAELEIAKREQDIFLEARLKIFEQAWLNVGLRAPSGIKYVFWAIFGLRVHPVVVIILANYPNFDILSKQDKTNAISYLTAKGWLKLTKEEKELLGLIIELDCPAYDDANPGFNNPGTSVITSTEIIKQRILSDTKITFRFATIEDAKALAEVNNAVWLDKEEWITRDEVIARIVNNPEGHIVAETITTEGKRILLGVIFSATIETKEDFKGKIPQTLAQLTDNGRLSTHNEFGDTRICFAVCVPGTEQVLEKKIKGIARELIFAQKDIALRKNAKYLLTFSPADAQQFHEHNGARLVMRIPNGRRPGKDAVVMQYPLNESDSPEFSNFLTFGLGFDFGLSSLLWGLVFLLAQAIPANSWQQIYQTAKRHLANKEFEAAISGYQKAIELLENKGVSNDRELTTLVSMHCELAEALSEVQREPEAINHFQKAMDLDESNFGIPDTLAEFYLKVREYPEAEKFLHIACERLLKYPQNAAHQSSVSILANNIGFYLSIKEDKNKIIQIVVTILQANTSFIAPLLKAIEELTLAASDSGKRNQIIDLLESLIQLEEVRKNPEFMIVALTLLAGCYVEENNLDKAYERLNEAETIASNLKVSNSVKARVYFYLATVQRLEGKLDEAMANLQKSYNLDPNQIIVIADLGELYFLKQNCQAVIDLIEPIRGQTGFKPDFKQPIVIKVFCYFLAVAYMSLDKAKPQSARKYIEETLKYAKPLGDAAIELYIGALAYKGRVYRFEGKLQKAIATLEEVRTLIQEKSIKFARAKGLYFDLMSCHKELGNSEPVLELLKQARQEGVITADILNIAAIVQGDRGNNAEAILLYQEALPTAQRGYFRAMLLSNLALEYLNTEKFDEAKRLAQEALLEDPNYPNTYATMALVYLANDEFDDANHFFEQAEEHNYDSLALRVNRANLYVRRPDLGSATDVLMPILKPENESELRATISPYSPEVREGLVAPLIDITCDYFEQLHVAGEELKARPKPTNNKAKRPNQKKTLEQRIQKKQQRDQIA
ncbi:MAG: hypothetical protein Q8O13_07795, partial [Candidatus Omnitrophota bacterium]|nr:hypothetical protein [Candidatus Omnitrophota bacterium]